MLEREGISLKNPRVSIIMSVYNSEKWIDLSINSILNQSFHDFELIIIDDCSTDNTLNVLYKIKDRRVKIYRNEKNKGLTTNLNFGIINSLGEYIARMDADDIANLSRIESQVKYLDKNLHIDVLGSRINVFGDAIYSVNYPLNHNDIVSALCFYNPIAHPSVMIRRKSLKPTDFYDESIKKAQDYELWCRLSANLKFANHRRKLLNYRTHERQISKFSVKEQNKYTYQIRSKYLIFHGLNEEQVKKVFEIEECEKITPLLLNEYETIFNNVQGFNHRSMKKQLLIQKMKLILASNDSKYKRFKLLVRQDKMIGIWFMITRLLQ